MVVPSSAVRSLRARSCVSVTARQISALPIGLITMKKIMNAVKKLTYMRCLYTVAIGNVQTGGVDVRGKPSRGLRCGAFRRQTSGKLFNAAEGT